jgi:hypothetical protein
MIDPTRMMGVRTSPLLVSALGLLVAVGLAGCGGSGTGTGGGVSPSAPPAEAAPVTSARADLAARAAAAQDLVAVSIYTLATPGRADRTVMVVRASDGGWRVDVPGGALGGAADVSIVGTGAGLFHCALSSPERAEAACVPVDRLTADIDPRVHHVFTDWPDVFTDRGAALAVSAEAPPDGVDGVGGECFAVEPSAASLVAPVDPGVYCYQTDGTLTGAELGVGTLMLVRTGEAAPPTVEMPGPVATDGEPLPTASPPPPSPSPTATPRT